MKSYKITFIATTADNVPEDILKRLEHHADELLDLESWPEIESISGFKVEKIGDPGIMAAEKSMSNSDCQSRSPFIVCHKEYPKPVGVYPLTNTASLLVYKIDDAEEKTLVGLNTEDPEWCEIKENGTEASGEPVLGFYWGELFVPFTDIMRSGLE